MNHSRALSGLLATVTITVGALIAGCSSDAAQPDAAAASAEEALVTIHCAPNFEPECTTCGHEEGCRKPVTTCWCLPVLDPVPAACAVATADAIWAPASTASGDFSSSTTAYASTACGGYVVDAQLSAPVPFGPSGSGWAERDLTLAPVTTQAACEATVVSTEIWSMSSTPPTLLRTNSTHGAWQSSGCFAATNFGGFPKNDATKYRWVARASELGSDGVPRPKPLKITTAF